MRIIAGTHRSRRIEAPNGKTTRPTLDKVREAVFSSLGGFFDSGTVLDLFAGSGAVSFEALSRGMDHAILCDIDRNAIMTIKRNAETLGLSDRCEIVQMKAGRLLEKLATEQVKVDLVYLDPPYRKQENEHLAQLLVEYNLLNEDATVIFESLKEETFSPAIKALRCYKEAVYGISRITYYKLDKE